MKMSIVDRWLLPDGVEDVLPPQAARMEEARRRLLDLFSTWGYDYVIPPIVEYLESLLTGTGHDLDLKTLKVTDLLSGRTMGLRADITPQVARIDAPLVPVGPARRTAPPASPRPPRPPPSAATAACPKRR